MAIVTQRVLVCGLPGVGKTTLVDRLSAEGMDAQELTGLTAPAAEASGETMRVVTVVDCANFARQIEDGVTGQLLRRQIEAAGVIVLSRGDLADPAPVHAWLANAGAFSVVEPNDAMWALQNLAPVVLGPTDPADDFRHAFGTWIYRGPAKLGLARAERLAEERPKGLIRLQGQILTEQGGLEIQVAGRVRQTRTVLAPTETELSAIWPKAVMRLSEVESWFAEAVADSSHAMGMFGYR